MSLSLPAYATLTPAEQLFVVVNLERTERRTDSGDGAEQVPDRGRAGWRASGP